MRRKTQDAVRAVSLAVLMICSMIGGGVTFTGSVAADHPDVDVSTLDGSGTENDPYVITTAPELQAMEDDLSANYVLGTDINASETTQWNGGSGFDPVGSDFTGSLNGDGHRIIGVTINRPNAVSVGLFNEFDDATVTNLSLIDATVTGDRRVGLLVGGTNGGSIRNVTTSGSVTGTTNLGGIVGDNREGLIVNSDSSADVSGSSQDVGGLVGENNAESIINDSYATGDVTGNSTDIGGLVGRNIGQIRGSYATGNVDANERSSEPRSANQPGNRVGGLAGYNQGNIIESHATGSVTGTTRVGGLVGVNFDYNGTQTVVRSSYATGDVSGTGVSVGGLVGSNFEGAAVGNLVPSLEVRVTNSYATGDVTGGSDFTGGLIGYNNGTVSQSFAAGEVVADGGTIGGLAGENAEQIDNSYWDTQTTRRSEPVGSGTGLTTVEGLTTAEMQGDTAQENMPELDFETTWQTQPDDYLTLRALTQNTDQSQAPPDEPRTRALQLAGKQDPAELTQDDVTAAVTRFSRGQSVNNVDPSQDDITVLITLFERN